MNCTRSWLIFSWKNNAETARAAGYPAAHAFKTEPGMIEIFSGLFFTVPVDIA